MKALWFQIVHMLKTIMNIDASSREEVGAYIPDFTDEKILSVIAQNDQYLQEKIQDRREVPGIEIGTKNIKHAVCQYFADRCTPKFFFDPGDVEKIWENLLKQNGDWWSKVFDQSLDACENGLYIYSRKSAPLDFNFPWGGIPHGPGDDRLYTKRPHRFAFFPRLAIASLADPEYVKKILGILKGWMKYAESSHNRWAYDSNLAVIQRMLALTWGWVLLASFNSRESESDKKELQWLILKVLAADIEYLIPRIGRSYPNNHLLADAFGGWFIGLFWSELTCIETNFDQYETLWLNEVVRQIYEDGTSFEHSTHYHEYACEMLSTYVLLSRRNGIHCPETVLKRAEYALRFQADLSGSKGFVIPFGDTVEDPLVCIDIKEGWSSAAWREIGRKLFGWNIRQAVEGAKGMEKAIFMLAGELREPWDVPTTSNMCSYPKGGFYIFNDRTSDSELVFRTGPSEGLETYAGHGHSDLLSIYLKVKGDPLIVSSGTYTYRFKSRLEGNRIVNWRKYFVGPKSHNGPILVGEDSLGKVKGDFREQDPRAFARTTTTQVSPVLNWVESMIITEGLQRNQIRGVVHIPGLYWLIYDKVPEQLSDRKIEYRYQLDENCRLCRNSTFASEISLGDNTVTIANSDMLGRPVVKRGDIKEPAGWVSKSYGQKAAAPQLIYSRRNGELITAILIGTGEYPGCNIAVTSEHRSEEKIRIRIGFGPYEDTLVINRTGTNIGVDVEDLSFDGKALWIRKAAGELREIRGLGGSQIHMKATGTEITSKAHKNWIKVRFQSKGWVSE